MSSSFSNIGLQGSGQGSVSLKASGVEWRGVKGAVKDWPTADLSALHWNVYGQRGYLKLTTKSGDWNRLDGFAKSDFDTLAELVNNHYGFALQLELVSSEGASFGDLTLHGTTIKMTSLSSQKPIFELKIDDAAQVRAPYMRTRTCT